MGFLFKALIIFAVIYTVLALVVRFLFGTRRKSWSSPRAGQSKQQENVPETQEERILDYQRKSFEKADVTDAEFEEVK